MNKVREINLERGYPTVETAINRMTNDITTAKMSGYKAAMIIHGFGSGGTGGSIKAAVKKQIKNSKFLGIIRDSVSGEDWYSKKREFLSICPQLKRFERHIDGNRGVTVLLFKK